MKDIVITKRINAPRERVFAVYTDLHNAPKNVTGIMKLDVLTPGPIGKGTRFRETRKMLGKEATETMEIIECTPPASYSVAANSCGCAYLSTFKFASAGAATDMEVRFRATPIGLMAKLMSPLGSLMAGMLRKCLDKDMTELQQLAERPAA